MLRNLVSGFVFLSVALLMGAPQATRAAESYDNCTGYVSSIPAVISTQGTWCLNQNLTTSITTGAAIKINADNVTLDCNDFKLDGLSAGSGTTATGVTATSHVNATVRNCIIRGFYYGANLSGTGHDIEDNSFEGNTFVSVRVQGDGSVVQRNRIFDTGTPAAGTTIFAIYVLNSVDVLDNTISSVSARPGSNGSVFGIYTVSNLGGSISGNRVRAMVQDGTGVAVGIYNSTSDRITLRGNDLVGNASAGSIGIRCASNHGRTKENVINGFVTGISNCSNDGGNVTAP